MKLSNNMAIAGVVTALMVVFFTAATMRHQNGEAPQSSVSVLDTPEDNASEPVASTNNVEKNATSVLEKSLAALTEKADDLSVIPDGEPTGQATEPAYSALEKRMEAVDSTLANIGVVTSINKETSFPANPQQAKISTLEARLKAVQ